VSKPQTDEHPFREPTNRSNDSIGQQLVSTLSDFPNFRSRLLENNVSWENPIIELDFSSMLYSAPIRCSALRAEHRSCVNDRNTPEHHQRSERSEQFQ
jgi:hypothetical protein